MFELNCTDSVCGTGLGRGGGVAVVVVGVVVLLHELSSTHLP